MAKEMERPQRQTFGFKWSENPVLALGVYFSYDKVKSDKCNFEEKLDKL